MATRRERLQYELDATDNASRVFRGVEGSAKRLQGAYRDLSGAVTLLASGAFVRAMVRAAVAGEESQNRLSAALRATGERIGITRKELDELADSMASATTFDDDAIRNAQGQLVKFGNITGDTFRGALAAAADLAAFMGTDIPSAAQLVGRALQSPTEGATLLERITGKLTEAQEKNIKSLASQGRAAEAQAEILRILENRIGGTAREMNTGLTAATSGVAKAWDDMLESWGRSELVGGRISKMLTGIRDILKDLELGAQENPLMPIARALNTANEQIERAERALRDQRAQRRAWGGPGTPDDPANAALAARIEEMKRQRHALLVQYQAIAADQKREKDDAAARGKSGGLGGTTGLTAEQERARAQQDLQAAMWSQLAADREAEFNDPAKLEKQLEGLLPTPEQLERAFQQQTQQLADHYQRVQDVENEFLDPGKLEAALNDQNTIAQREYEKRLATLRQLREQGLMTEAEYNDRERELTFDHQRRLTGMWQFAMTERERFARMSTRQQVETVVGGFEQMTAIGATQSKKWFEINKQLSAGMAAIKGYEAINSAYAWGATWGGPPGGAAMAALAALAVGAQVVAIESQKFGGGASVPTFGASAVSALPQQQEAPRARGPDTFVTLRGDDLFTGRTMARFFERANEFIRDGGRFVVEVQE